MLLRDPIHGDIELTAAERAVLDLPEMQRLRGIKQLGTAYLVYPGAMHTRFDHSLGVCTLAHRLVQNLIRAGHVDCAEYEQAIGLAALLHDITHIPFGHTLEDERRLFARHDKGGRTAFFLAGPVGDVLKRFGEFERVSALLGVDRKGVVPVWARQIVSGAIDADLLDYLRRDSFFTGVSHGYDDRILRCFDVLDGQLVIRLVKHGLDRPDARSEAISVLRLRYFLTERVYYHHTKVVAGAMISKAVEWALAEGDLEEQDFLKLNDWTLLAQLQQSRATPIRRLSEQTQHRALLKRAYVISGQELSEQQKLEWVSRYHARQDLRAEAERRIADELGLNFCEVVVYCPALTVMKEAAVPVETREGFMLLNQAGSAAEAEIKALQERYADLWRFYVFVPEASVAKARRCVEEYLGVPSEYLPKPTCAEC